METSVSEALWGHNGLQLIFCARSIPNAILACESDDQKAIDLKKNQ